MKKQIFKKSVVAGIAVATAVQAVPAMAMTTNKGGGVGATGKATIHSSSEIKSSQIYKETAPSGISGMTLIFTKGSRVGSDPNREEYQELKDAGTNIIKTRYTHKDGTPFTGLYLETRQDGSPYHWIVLDKDGFLGRDSKKRQFAWDNGKETSDFMIQAGPNYDEEDGNYYLGEQSSKDGAPIVYIAVNKWVQNGAGIGSVWYRSNDKGICYRNQWFKDPSSGKWYYFGSDCKMVTNQSIDGYWIGADGVWQG